MNTACESTMEVMLEECISISLENELVLSYIESTLNQVITQIQIRPPGTPQIVLHRIVSLDHSYDPVFGSILWHIKSCKVTYEWPGKTRQEAWRFGTPPQSIQIKVLTFASLS